MRKIRLGVNIDHVATLRNARGGLHPDVARAARLAEANGADGITIHLREDRRHIRDHDLPAIKAVTLLPINLEMAATKEMQEIALQYLPHACCIVPEKRREVTTEGGLNVADSPWLADFIQPLKEKNIRISLFIDADEAQIEAAAAMGADIIELHTGAYCQAPSQLRATMFRHLSEMAEKAHRLGLEIHAGHGLDYGMAREIAHLPHLAEVNIGHFLVGEAVFIGLGEAIRTMRQALDDGHHHP